jgi:hypothetical protein
MVIKSFWYSVRATSAPPGLSVSSPSASSPGVEGRFSVGRVLQEGEDIMTWRAGREDDARRYTVVEVGSSSYRRIKVRQKRYL